MGIDLEWTNEDRSTIQFLGDGAGTFTRILLNAGDQSDTCCLQFIDPFGDTIFNQRQLSVLTLELKVLLSELSDTESQEKVKAILKLLGQAEGKTHTYIKFVGD